MNKYTEAATLIIEEHRQDRCWTKESFEAAQKIKEACSIADSLENTDVSEARFDYCNNVDCDGFCDSCRILIDFTSGYEKALKDVRDDDNEN